MSTTVRLTVGEVDGDCAVLTSNALHVVRLPLALLPPDVAVGHMIDMSTVRSLPAEQAREREICSLQAELQKRLGPAEGSSAMASSVHDVLSS